MSELVHAVRLNNNSRNSRPGLAVFCLVFGLVFLAASGQWANAAWQAPSTLPPACPAGAVECVEPLNEGPTSQVKAGSLGIGVSAMSGFDLEVEGSGFFIGPLVTLGNVIFGAKAGIGPGFVAASPSTLTIDQYATLDLDGQIKVRGGAPALGRALMTDASGFSSWQTSPREFGDSVMYLRIRFFQTAPTCPSGWSQADLKTEYVSNGNTNNVRTCFRTDAACRVVYLSSTNPTAPAACPTGFTEAGASLVFSGSPSTQLNYVRTCFACASL